MCSFKWTLWVFPVFLFFLAPVRAPLLASLFPSFLHFWSGCNSSFSSFYIFRFTSFHSISSFTSSYVSVFLPFEGVHALFSHCISLCHIYLVIYLEFVLYMDTVIDIGQIWPNCLLVFCSFVFSDLFFCLYFLISLLFFFHLLRMLYLKALRIFLIIKVISGILY